MTITVDFKVIIGVLIAIIIIEGIAIINLISNKINISYNGKSDEWLRKMLEGLRLFWPRFTIYIIGTGTVGLFIASYVMKQEPTLEVINTWVSMVLGLVALIIGIISLYLSFYNLDQANDTQIKTHDNLTSIKTTIEEGMYDVKIAVIEGTKNLATKEDLNAYWQGGNAASAKVKTEQEQVKSGWQNVKKSDGDVNE
ncbi:hypothetical protein [Anaerotignum sp.]